MFLLFPVVSRRHTTIQMIFICVVRITLYQALFKSSAIGSLFSNKNIHRQKNGGLLWSFRLEVEGEAEYEIITKKSYV